MEALNDDILPLIISHSNIRGLVNLKRVCKGMYIRSQCQEDELIYSIASVVNKQLPANMSDNLYQEYFRGKSYIDTAKGVDIPFEFSDSEHILAYRSYSDSRC